MPKKVQIPDEIRLIYDQGSIKGHGSIIEICSDEELFLSFSESLKNGPGIYRNGLGPPWMEVIGQPGKITTNDREQRWASWFIDKASKRISIDHWYDGTRGDTPNHNVDEWRKHIQQLSFHTGDFERAYGKLYEIVGQQGAGDLTMNDWNVAFVKSWQTSDNPELTRHVPDLLFLLEEPLWLRSYTCLTKRRGNKVSIEEGVRFSHVPDFRIFIGDSDITDEVELAISGRQVIRDGEVVDFIDKINVL